MKDHKCHLYHIIHLLIHVSSAIDYMKQYRKDISYILFIFLLGTKQIFTWYIIILVNDLFIIFAKRNQVSCNYHDGNKLYGHYFDKIPSHKIFCKVASMEGEVANHMAWFWFQTAC